MHNCEDIEDNRCFSNGGTNLHIHAIAQGRPDDNQVEFLQGTHGIVNPPKNIVLNNIRNPNGKWTMWNALPNNLRLIDSVDLFKRHLKTHLCKAAFSDYSLWANSKLGLI